MLIRETTDADINDILMIERLAFKRDVEVNFTRDLLVDPSAKPLLSLLAFVEGKPVGHILFSKAHVENTPHLKASFLAPLAVIPEFQKRGIGGNLIKEGLQLQTQSGIDLVFLLGHPTYYPKFGFISAAKAGFETTYPIPPEHFEAWMVKVLRPNIIGTISGRVLGCDVMNRPQNWRVNPP